MNTNTVQAKNNPGLRTRGASFHWWDAEYTSMHNHDYYEFFIITSGRTSHMLNNQPQTLGAKTFCLIYPEDQHQFTPIQGERCIHINLAVTGEKLQALCQSVGTSLEQLRSCPNRMFQLTDSEFSFFKHNARELGFEPDNSTREEYTSMIIFEMLIHGIILLNKHRFSIDSSAPEWLNHLLRRIHSPEYLDCHASDIYALAGYSPPVVIQCFRQYTGETVISYLTKVKIEAAKMMLSTGNLTVLDIAGRLGYSSLSHFNKNFKEAVGMSPGKYRLQYRSL